MPSAEAALILHRKGFDCGLEAKNLGFNCTTSQGKVSRAPVWEGPLTRGGREMGRLGRAGVREVGETVIGGQGSLWAFAERKGEAADVRVQSW